MVGVASTILRLPDKAFHVTDFTVQLLRSWAAVRAIIVAIKQWDNRVFALKERFEPILHQSGHVFFVIFVFCGITCDFQHAAAATAMLVLVQSFG